MLQDNVRARPDAHVSEGRLTFEAQIGLYVMVLEERAHRVGRDLGVILRRAYDRPIHPRSCAPTLTKMEPEQQSRSVVYCKY